MIENYKYIRFFGQISGKDAKTAGGKAANLARLVRAGIPVPNGFAILTPAFLELSKASNIGEKIEAVQSKIDAAIVSRELGIPGIVSTKIATQVLKDGDIIEVDADNGIVKIVEKTR